MSQSLLISSWWKKLVSAEFRITFEFALEEDDTVDLRVVHYFLEPQSELASVSVVGVLTVHVGSVGHLSVLQSERQVNVHLALSAALESVVVRPNHGVSEVDVAHSLIRVEEV